jgi:hypothetical protein
VPVGHTACVSFPTPAPFHLQEMAPPRRRRWLPVGLAVVGVLLLAGVAVFLALRPHPVPATADPTAGLVAACRAEAERHLKAPSTARWSGESTRPGNNSRQFYVDGSVEAQNSFGALVVNKYYCDATKTGDGWSAKVTFGAGT